MAIAKYADEALIFASGAAFARNPKWFGLKFIQSGSFITRFGGNFIVGGARGALATTWTAGGTFTVGAFLAAVGGGVALGIGTVGFGSAYAESRGWISQGITKQYLDSHTSFTGLKSVYNVPKNISTIAGHYFS